MRAKRADTLISAPSYSRLFIFHPSPLVYASRTTLSAVLKYPIPSSTLSDPSFSSSHFPFSRASFSLLRSANPAIFLSISFFLSINSARVVSSCAMRSSGVASIMYRVFYEEWG